MTTREILIGEYLTLLPPDKVIAEIPDSVAMDGDVVNACKKLKESGPLALSNFRNSYPREQLLAGIASAEVAERNPAAGLL